MIKLFFNTYFHAIDVFWPNLRILLVNRMLLKNLYLSITLVMSLDLYYFYSQTWNINTKTLFLKGGKSIVSLTNKTQHYHHTILLPSHHNTFQTNIPKPYLRTTIVTAPVSRQLSKHATYCYAIPSINVRLFSGAPIRLQGSAVGCSNPRAVISEKQTWFLARARS